MYTGYFIEYKWDFHILKTVLFEELLFKIYIPHTLLILFSTVCVYQHVVKYNFQLGKNPTWKNMNYLRLRLLWSMTKNEREFL